MKLDPYLSPYTKLNSKSIKDFNLNSDTLNLIDERVENMPEFVDTQEDFLERTLIV